MNKPPNYRAVNNCLNCQLCIENPDEVDEAIDIDWKCKKFDMRIGPTSYAGGMICDDFIGFHKTDDFGTTGQEFNVMATSCEKCGTYYEVSWKSEGDDAPMFCPFCGHNHVTHHKTEDCGTNSKRDENKG